MAPLSVCVIKLDKYEPFETWDDETNQLVRKPMHSVIECDGCGKVMHNQMETIYQIAFMHCVCFVCDVCKRILER